MKTVQIGERNVGPDYPTFFIAEVGSNFDGSLQRAKMFVDAFADMGADCIKFQSFLPDKIIAKDGFSERSDFQAKWDKSVYDVYSDATFPREWHKEIMDYCNECGIIFMSSPYDIEAVDLLEEIGINAYKLGSGEVSNPPFLEYVAKKEKPIIIGVGASTLGEIDEAVKVIRSAGNENLILMQCITGYPSPFEDANIRAMETLGKIFDLPVGYSDHTPGHVVPLGAVALGGCIIEKHVTDDRGRKGPDHPFALEIGDFKQMIDDVRLLEKSLGKYYKGVTHSESETVILQRRALWAKKDIPEGAVLEKDMIDILRPQKGILIQDMEKVIGLTVTKAVKKGQPIKWENFK